MMSCLCIYIFPTCRLLKPDGKFGENDCFYHILYCPLKSTSGETFNREGGCKNLHTLYMSGFHFTHRQLTQKRIHLKLSRFVGWSN